MTQTDTGTEPRTADLTWDDFLTERDQAHLARTSWTKTEPFGLGTRPAVLVIDAYYLALGTERLPILESIKTWNKSCGLDGWDAVDRTTEVVATARSAAVPVVHVTKLESLDAPWGRRDRSDGPAGYPDGQRDLRYRIVDELAPAEGELVVKKSAPSAFRGTPLNYYLNYHGIDTLVVCGEATSGCVRATVVDAATERYQVAVVEDACFDRTQASHWINLFDMHQKYADVVKASEAETYLRSFA